MFSRTRSGLRDRSFFDKLRLLARACLIVTVLLFLFSSFTYFYSSKVPGSVLRTYQRYYACPSIARRGKCLGTFAEIQYGKGEKVTRTFDVQTDEFFSPLDGRVPPGLPVAVRIHAHGLSGPVIDNVYGNFRYLIFFSLLSTIGFAGSSLEGASKRFGSLFTRVQNAHSFVVIVFSLLGKLAKSDGRVSEDEIAYIEKIARDTFSLTDKQQALAFQAFRAGRTGQRSFREYAQDCAEAYRRDPAMLHTIYFTLADLAGADGLVAPQEDDLLGQARFIFFGVHGTGGRFGTSEHHDASQSDRFSTNQSGFGSDTDESQGNPPQHASAKELSPYDVLGITQDATVKQLKSAYRKLVLQFHPDRLAARGVPEAMRSVSERKFKEIQNAYEHICAERGTT